MTKNTNQFLILCVAGVVLTLLLFLNDLTQSRLKYTAYIAAQAQVLACRSDLASSKPTGVIEAVCGPIPTLESLR